MGVMELRQDEMVEVDGGRLFPLWGVAAFIEGILFQEPEWC